MASEPVTPQQYPELETFELASVAGERGRFLGRITAQERPCAVCRTADTVTVYRGPQHGLAFDVPVNPFDTAPVDLELAWCSQHGVAGVRLLNQDDTEHTGL